jgi:hypothetical protein
MIHPRRVARGPRTSRRCARSALASLLAVGIQAPLWTPGCGGSTDRGRDVDSSTAADASEDTSREGDHPSDAHSETYGITPSSDAVAEASPAVAETDLTFPPCPNGCCQSMPGDLSCKTDCDQCRIPCSAPTCNATTCPMGCCDSSGQCVWNGFGSQTACGVCGASCVDCTLGGSYPGLFCQYGQCDQPHA